MDLDSIAIFLGLLAAVSAVVAHIQVPHKRVKDFKVETRTKLSHIKKEVKHLDRQFKRHV